MGMKELKENKYVLKRLNNKCEPTLDEQKENEEGKEIVNRMRYKEREKEKVREELSEWESE